MLSYKYDEQFESPLLRGIEENRPWNLSEKISIHLNDNKNLLDIGCGTGHKLLPLLNKISHCIGLEPNYVMRKKAVQNAGNFNVRNFFLVGGYAQQLPFTDVSFDIVTAIMAPYDINEIYRVLKPAGCAIIETIGERDKYDLKCEFGKDEQGWRGQLSHLTANAVFDMNKKEFQNLFARVTIRNGFWKTYYSREGLELLLEQTPTIRNYDKHKDQSALKAACRKYLTNKGIEATQHRVLIIARK